MALLTDSQLTRMAASVRLLSIDAIENAGSGHPGLPLGMADVMAVLWGEFLHVAPNHPEWPDRDRFVLSAGHGSMLLYSLLHVTGFEVSLADLKAFRTLHSRTPGHPEYGVTPGVEVTTGPLAQGLGHSVGMALAEALLRAEFGTDVCDHWTYVVAGDGCLMEGLSAEAISFAGHMKMSRLVVLFDDNRITIDGPTSLSTSENQRARFEAAGWHVVMVDGHNFASIRAGLQAAQAETAKPSLLMCRTVIGRGSPTKQGTAAAHGAPLGAEEAAVARASLGYGAAAPFAVPQDDLALWHGVKARGEAKRQAWQARQQADPHKAAAFVDRMERRLPAAWQAQVAEAFLKVWSPEHKATRQWSGQMLSCLLEVIPGLMGGSADLSPSNNTKTKAMEAVDGALHGGQYVHYGVREHLMAAAMGGMVLHGGYLPYGGTFLAFSDYMRPAVRLAALMNIPTHYVFTHDSIGLGEDGPTHQPVEHIESLRLMPNLFVFRPADGIETAECWMLMLKRTGPSALLLSRQKVSPLRRTLDLEATTARGGYVLSEASHAHQVTLVATGSEVSLAHEVRQQLEEQGVGVRLVSMPCRELFLEQEEAYQAEVLSWGQPVLRASIEAGATQGWRALLGVDALTFGVDGFGASAPHEALYAWLGLDVPSVVKAILARLASPRLNHASGG
ncbi:transketolase [Candidatus Hepatobacter penaei]|uniref:transketolase n=1 Tax=Candidatus Hepatobacter penaei TaxID=1274402 RepID=UPI0004F2DFDD|nr:transketolase [Candidatus Hepatobacter penaei]